LTLFEVQYGVADSPALLSPIDQKLGLRKRMKTRAVPWWQVYLVFAITIGLLFVEHQNPLALIPVRLVDAVILVLALGLIAAWVAHNQRALQRGGVSEEEIRRSLVVKIYQAGIPVNLAAKSANHAPGCLAADQAESFAPTATESFAQDWRRN
jgi:hypothetical protein